MMPRKRSRPVIVVLGGPNGAGKTTIAREVLEKTLGITEFVNADTIAAGLSGFDPERAAFAAGRVMLQRLHELGGARPRRSFAFETTLASRSFAPWLRAKRDDGWDIFLLYVWVRTPAISIARVSRRVQQGGHFVPPDTVRRRHARSATNLFDLYLALATAWRMYDNSVDGPASLIATFTTPTGRRIYDLRSMQSLEMYAHEVSQSRKDPGSAGNRD